MSDCVIASEKYKEYNSVTEYSFQLPCNTQACTNCDSIGFVKMLCCLEQSLEVVLDDSNNNRGGLPDFGNCLQVHCYLH